MRNVSAVYFGESDGERLSVREMDSEREKEKYELLAWHDVV